MDEILAVASGPARLLFLSDCSVATNKNESYWHNASLQAIGVMIALLVLLPSLIRRGEGQWAGIDWAVLVAGLLLALAWCTMTLVRVVRRHRGPNRSPRGVVRPRVPERG